MNKLNVILLFLGTYIGSLPLAMAGLKSFVDNEIVSDVVPVGPSQVLKINYPSGVEVSEGKELTPTSVKDAPTVQWQSEPNAFYTLCMTDPDAPSRANPTRREFLHWLVTNIPGNTLSAGDTLAEYIGSGPPQGTDLHRYIFFLYKQPGKINFEEQKINKNMREGRPLFSIAKFAQKYNLGNPVAGNFYQAQYDDYVPTVHKQLGI